MQRPHLNIIQYLAKSETCSGGSRHLGAHHVADPGIRLRFNLIGFSVWHVIFFAGGAKAYSQSGWRSWPDFPHGFATGHYFTEFAVTTTAACIKMAYN